MLGRVDEEEAIAADVGLDVLLTQEQEARVELRMRVPLRAHEVVHLVDSQVARRFAVIQRVQARETSG